MFGIQQNLPLFTHHCQKRIHRTCLASLQLAPTAQNNNTAISLGTFIAHMSHCNKCAPAVGAHFSDMHAASERCDPLFPSACEFARANSHIVDGVVI